MPDSPTAAWLGQVLPAVNASFNALSTALLLAGFAAIRRRHVKVHQRCMLAALASSALFLLGYLTRIYLTGTHRFLGPLWLKGLYLVILGSHMVLAVAVLPLIGQALYWAGTGQFARHRRVARVAFPVWLYVSVTGVVVYVLLYQVAPRLLLASPAVRP